MSEHREDLSLESLLVQPCSASGSLCTPIVQSTTFIQSAIGEPAPHAYSRVSNPTVDALEQRLGELEGALPAVCCSTGLAAETVLFLTLLKSGEHVVCARAVYGGTTRLLQQLLCGLGVEVTFVDASRPAAVFAAVRPNTRLVFLESPANPTLELTDIQRVASLVRESGACLAVDNTFLTPAGQRPLDLGAIVSVYSTTKLIDGHSAALGGALVSRDRALLDRFRFIRKSIGCIQTAFHAWLTLQGMKTLALRLRAQAAHAQQIAEWLQSRPEVSAVHYPGLESFPQRSLARKQHLAGDGNVVSLELRAGFDAAVELTRHLRRIRLAEHVGTVETLITHSASMTHADVPVEQRRAAGISDGLLRLSVGLEQPEELIGDLATALARLAEREADVETHAEVTRCAIHA